MQILFEIIDDSMDIGRKQGMGSVLRSGIEVVVQEGDILHSREITTGQFAGVGRKGQTIVCWGELFVSLSTSFILFLQLK